MNTLTLLSRPRTLVMHPHSTSHTRTSLTAQLPMPKALQYPWPRTVPRSGHRRCRTRPSGETEGGAGWVHPRSLKPSLPGGRAEAQSHPLGLPASGDGRGGFAPMCPTGRRERTTEPTHPYGRRLLPDFPIPGA